MFGSLKGGWGKKAQNTHIFSFLTELEVQREVTKMIVGLEHVLYEKGMKSLELVLKRHKEGGT